MSGRTTGYYAVVGTNRGDFEEWGVALVSSYAMARVAGWQALDVRPRLLRCRVRWVELPREQVVEIVVRWGKEDAAIGRPVSDADRLPDPYRDVYLTGYRAAVEATGPSPESGR